MDTLPGISFNIPLTGESLQPLTFMVLALAVLVFSILSVALFYHWESYGKETLNRTLIMTAYFGGSAFFIISAFLSALAL